MGTYTANYQLYMPSIGEQGWGDLMNGNLTTIDTTMAGLNVRMGTAETNITSLTTRMGTAETTIASNKSRIGTLETETAAVEEIVTALEPLSVIQVDENQNVTFPAGVSVGTLNFKEIKMPTLSYDGTFTITLSSSTFPLFYSPFPISGKIAIKLSLTHEYNSGSIRVFNGSGYETTSVNTITFTEIPITNAYSIELLFHKGYSPAVTATIGKFVYI